MEVYRLLDVMLIYIHLRVYDRVCIRVLGGLHMDWRTVQWLAIIVAAVIFILVINRYCRKRKNNRRLEIGNDTPIVNFTDSLSSGNGLKPKFGGGSGGGGGATRSFAASPAESAGIADARIANVNSIVTGEFTGDVVSSGSLLSSEDIVQPNAAIDTATNLLPATMDTEGVVTAAVEFMSDAAGNTIEAAGEVVGAVAEVAGEIVTEIISGS